MDETRIMIEGVMITSLKQIKKSGGSIFHALKKNELSFHGFGEAYFSHIDFEEIKAWKIHREMWLNLIVPVGSVKFVLCDQRENSITKGNLFEIVLNPETNYKRLTIPPGITFGFKGVGDKTNLVLNVASIEHNPAEVENMDIKTIEYSW